MMRFARATLVAPLMVPLLYCVGSLAAALADPSRRAWAGQNLLNGSALVFVVGAPVAYAATALVALPALLLVRRFGPLTLARTVIVGLVVGVGVAVAMGPPLRGELVSVPLPPWSGGLMGVAAAAVWWKVAAGGAGEGQSRRSG
jgi:hypothetical protein